MLLKYKYLDLSKIVKSALTQNCVAFKHYVILTLSPANELVLSANCDLV